MRTFNVRVKIDRPIGYQDDHGNVYPVNYGFVPGIFADDGEEQDVYVLTTEKKPLETFTGEVIAIIRRKNDVEDKWVAVPKGSIWNEAEIWKQVAFIEQYFDASIEMLDPA